MFQMEKMSHQMQTFTEHRVCWLFREDIISTHAFGDGLTMLAYYLIPIALGWILYKYNFGFWLKAIFGVYGGFILLCGTTHLLDLIMIWYINEDVLIFDGYLRVVTGIFSMFSFGVTVYAALSFRQVFDELLLIKAEMVADKEKFNRVSDSVMQRIDNVLTSINEAVTPIKGTNGK